jgi:hypothetical protein
MVHKIMALKVNMVKKTLPSQHFDIFPASKLYCGHFLSVLLFALFFYLPCA